MCVKKKKEKENQLIRRYDPAGDPGLDGSSSLTSLGSKRVQPLALPLPAEIGEYEDVLRKLIAERKVMQACTLLATSQPVWFMDYLSATPFPPMSLSLPCHMISVAR